MNEILVMMLTLLAGLVLGTIFFGGLWYTVKKAITSKIPALWFLGSFFIRVSITMIGFYYIGAGNWQRLVICLLGFVTARFMVTHLTKLNETKQIQLKREVGNES